MSNRAPQFRYLAPPSGQWSGNTVEITERAIGLHEAARAVFYVLAGYTVIATTIRCPGRLSDTRLATAPTAEHEGTALWCGPTAVSLLAASSTSGRWHQGSLRSIERLAHGDRMLSDRWHATATRFVITNQSAITKVAVALLERGALDANELLWAMHALDPMPGHRKSEAQDQQEVAAWQRQQWLAQLHLRRGLSNG
jgi:hypothetical protein